MTQASTTTEAAPTMRRLDPLFSPRSIALVGASDRSAWSVLIDAALARYGFDGNVHLVNARGGEAHGRAAATSLSALPEVPDLVFLMIPSQAVVATLEEAAGLGVRAAEILSSGFAETGEQGAALQAEVAALAARTGMAILGPNNLGFINVTRGVGLAPSAPGEALRAGSIAMVSQSGNLMGQIQGLATMLDIGLSLLVSTGNEVDVAAEDVVDHIVDDADTAAIGIFVESIRDPKAFQAAAIRARRAGKLVVILKVGRSEAAARSALAHTGALVGDDAIVDAALEAAGVVRVDSLEDLLATAEIFTRIGPIDGRRVGVVSISGGAGDIAGDLADAVGLEIPTLAPETAAKLVDVLPDYGTPQNPLDVTGLVVSRPEIFGQGLAALGRDPGLDIIIAITEAEHMAADRDDPMLAGLLHASETSRVPVLLTTTTVKAPGEHTRALRRGEEWPTVSWGLQRTLSAIAALERWSRLVPADEEPLRGAIDVASYGPPIGTWSELRARRLLEAHDVPMVPAAFVPAGEFAPQHLEDGVRYAVKVVSDDIAHKSDVGGVALDVSRADVATAVERVLGAAAEAAPDARIDGALVSPMRAPGVDLLVGVVRDETWGCVLAIAMGGIWTEVLGDVSRVALPTTPARVRAALESLRAAPLLHGARGTRPVDIDAVVDAIAAIANLAVALGPELAALEVNPLRAGTDVEALDAVVVWRTPDHH